MRHVVYRIMFKKRIRTRKVSTVITPMDIQINKFVMISATKTHPPAAGRKGAVVRPSDIGHIRHIRVTSIISVDSERRSPFRIRIWRNDTKPIKNPVHGTGISGNLRNRDTLTGVHSAISRICSDCIRIIPIRSGRKRRFTLTDVADSLIACTRSDEHRIARRLHTRDRRIWLTLRRIYICRLRASI